MSRSRDRNGDRDGRRDRNKDKKVEEEEEEKTQEQIEEEELMKKVMGFTHFDSTKVNISNTILRWKPNFSEVFYPLCCFGVPLFTVVELW